MRTRHITPCARQALALGLLVALISSRSLTSPTTDVQDPPQDTFVQPLSVHAVCKPNSGVEDEIYSCATSATYDHPQKPPLCREEDVVPIDNLSAGVAQRVRRRISGRVTYAENDRKTRTVVDKETAEQQTEEAWVWTARANEVPQAGGAPGLTITNTDAARLNVRTQSDGGEGDRLALGLMDIPTSAMKYSQAAMKTSLPGRLNCHERLAHCTLSTAKQARRASSISPAGGREEAECLSSLLLEKGNGCSAADAFRAHLTVGMFLLTQEWDVSGALDHFVAATTTDGGESLSKEGRHQDNISGGEWGAVWLAHAIQGRVNEAKIGVAANATAIGEGWAHNHLRSWRRHLSRKSSGIGMAGVVEGAERLILAAANEENNSSMVAVVVADLHLALARTLLLHGAFEEADGHVRSSERLLRVAQDTPDGKGFPEGHSAKAAAGGALRLEMTLLSHTPVVAASGEEVVSLRRELMEALRHMATSRAFEGSIPNPLEVGVRAQFLLAYQGLNDKAAAIALARVFDKASGSTRNYYSPHLSSSSGASADDNHGPGINSADIDNETLRHAGTKEHATSHDIAAQTKAAAATQHVGVRGDATVDGVEYCEENVKATAGTPAVSTAGTAGIPQPERTVRVGFLSAHFRWHSVGRLTVGLLEELSRNVNGLEIFVIHTSSSVDGDRHKATDAKDGNGEDSGSIGGRGDRTENDTTGDSIQNRLATAGASIVWLPPTPPPAADHINGFGGINSNNGLLGGIRETVAALKLDVLVFGDVGMDALTTGLAHSRLAPVQVAFWGHPSTTGLSTVDYFVTSDLFEGEISRHDHDDDDGDNVCLCMSSNRRAKRRRRRQPFEGADGDGIVCGGGGGGSEEEPDRVIDEQAVDHTARGDHDGSEALHVSSEEQRNSRQEAFSEQLVRLGGLGIMFDDPIETFQVGEPSDDATAAALLRSPSARLDLYGDEPDGVEKKHGRNSNNDRPAMVNSWDPGRRVGGALTTARRDDPTGTGTAEGDPHRPRLYVCAQSLMKMHPAFDTVIADILGEDPLAHIILIRDSRQLLWHSRFRRRLRAVVDAAEEKRSNASTLFAAATATATTSNAIDVSNNFPLPSPQSPTPSRDDTSTAFSSASSLPSDRSAPSTNTEATPVQQPRETVDVTAGTTPAIAHGDPPQPKQQQRQASAGKQQFWSRVRFVSPLSGRDFFRLQCRADIVLDPFPFGGGVTIIEALACGTPVVTSGAMQSVHRLAEGMIAAVSARAGGGVEGLLQEGKVEAGTPTTASCSGVAHRCERGGGEDSSDEHVVACRSHTDLAGGGGHSPVAHDEDNGTAEHGNGNRAADGNAHEGGNCSKPCGGGGGGCVLVDNLVASSTADYVNKAVAVAAPGLLRDRVRDALWIGRDGILKGDGSVATDWERFLKNAAASSATVANVSDM